MCKINLNLDRVCVNGRLGMCTVYRLKKYPYMLLGSRSNQSASSYFILTRLDSARRHGFRPFSFSRQDAIRQFRRDRGPVLNDRTHAHHFRIGIRNLED